jgi:hypothetical protein
MCENGNSSVSGAVLRPTVVGGFPAGSRRESRKTSGDRMPTREPGAAGPRVVATSARFAAESGAVILLFPRGSFATDRRPVGVACYASIGTFAGPKSPGSRISSVRVSPCAACQLCGRRLHRPIQRVLARMHFGETLARGGAHRHTLIQRCQRPFRCKIEAVDGLAEHSIGLRIDPVVTVLLGSKVHIGVRAAAIACKGSRTLQAIPKAAPGHPGKALVGSRTRRPASRDPPVASLRRPQWETVE